MLKGVAVLRFSLMKTARVEGRHMPAQVMHEGSAMLWLDKMKKQARERKQVEILHTKKIPSSTTRGKKGIAANGRRIFQALRSCNKGWDARKWYSGRVPSCRP
jgi:hypothetical protein